VTRLPTAERDPLRLSDPGVPEWISHVAECVVCGPIVMVGDDPSKLCLVGLLLGTRAVQQHAARPNE